MNLRDLKYLIAVAETRHFGKAADRCFVSQPTLSGQIKKLEDELDIKLFERTNRSVKITPVGETVLQHAYQIMEQADSIMQLAHSHSDPLAGPLRLGAIPTISPYLMPLILLPMKQQFPQLRLVLSEEMTGVLLTRLHNHEIDVALLATPVDDQDFQTVPLYDEPFWLAYPRDHAFYTQENISRRDLEKTDLLLLSEGHCLADQAMSVCRLQNRDNQGDMADLRAASLETLLQLVAAGMGSTLVPALALRGSWTTGSGIVTRKLELPDARRRVSLVFRKTFPRRQAIDALADLIRQQLPTSVKVVAGKRASRKQNQ
ncbi:MAG: LysR substrate-binding domain-containing protein [Gammaproteobacteria bacterium]|nr:LysR substrate-binding domain-containing protein [Gammaproteobacteria bacterium]